MACAARPPPGSGALSTRPPPTYRFAGMQPNGVASHVTLRDPEWASLPAFPVQIATPDLNAWCAGNTGLRGVWSFAGPAPGPHVGIVALIHGNEIAGAAALATMLAAGVSPSRGRITLIFANLEAFARFDPAQPTASRFVDEDLNRVWDPAVLDSPRTSLELARARALRPVIDSLDVLLDLHSMLWPGDPLILCGPSERGRALGVAAGAPGLVVADSGHISGRRLIDYPPFIDPNGHRTAILVEAGQHWEFGTEAAMLRTINGVLAAKGLAPRTTACLQPRCAEVTLAVTATTGDFAFARPFRGGDIVAQRDTLIATDGGVDIRTPHDDCLLIMPSLRPSRGHTAVRLARFMPAESCGG